jgi:GT2 family glycosyltransferase
MPDAPAITVGITTRNRPEALVRCLDSLALLGPLVADVVVVDDAGDVDLGPVLDRVAPAVRARLLHIRQEGGLGYIVARNTIVRRAATPYVLLLDDDAYVIDAGGIGRAVALLEAEPRMAAVGCAQAEADGSPWPAGMQPAAVGHPSVVTAYIGFAHLVRRSVFVALGGYREAFHFYGEEKDYCLRVLEAGYAVAYLPDTRVAHVPDRAGRDPARYLRAVVRNDCLFALYNEPWMMALVSVPVRLRRYLVMRRHAGVRDPGGLGWIAREIVRALPRVWHERAPVRWRTIRQWRRLHRAPRAIAPVAEAPARLCA